MYWDVCDLRTLRNFTGGLSKIAAPKPSFIPDKLQLGIWNNLFTQNAITKKFGIILAHGNLSKFNLKK